MKQTNQTKKIVKLIRQRMQLYNDMTRALAEAGLLQLKAKKLNKEIRSIDILILENAKV